MSASAAWSPLVFFLSLAVSPGSAMAQAQATASAEPSIGERVSVPDGAYWSISVPELQSMLAQKDFPLVNVHVPFQGDLPETDLSIPFDEIAEHLDALPEDKDAVVVLYCRSGPMGVQAATTLAGLGYTRVYNLAGGFRAWGEAGLPFLNP